jgi:hypothetical protein
VAFSFLILLHVPSSSPGSSQNTGSGGSYGPSTSFSPTSPLQRMPTNVSSANVPVGSTGTSGEGALNVLSNMSRTSITGSDAYSIHYDVGTGTSTANSSSSGVNTIMDNGLGANVKHPYTVLKRGKKHHAFSTEAVPYPLNYETRILDWYVPCFSYILRDPHREDGIDGWLTWFFTPFFLK